MKAKFPAAALPICLTIVAAVTRYAPAGDLNPPAGPVSPTMKTLVEVEPRIAVNATNTPGDADSLFKITQRGSYYLTDNIQGVAAKHGIEITAIGVTLDLNGFELLGQPGSLDGVSVTVGGLSNIAVVNGSVRNWGDKGVDLVAFAASNCRVADLLASGNAGNGISTGAGSTVTNCSAYQNTGFGISVGNGSTVTNCSAVYNALSGISTGGTSGCTVSNCSAFANSGNGIATGTGCTVADCTATINTLDGIVCSFACVVRGNTCSSNGSGGDGAGIHVTSSDNRIEGNNCTGADRGIDVDTGGNFITRNTCASNTTNWDVVAGNVILVVNAATAGAISGNSGGTAPGSTDPNANFTY